MTLTNIRNVYQTVTATTTPTVFTTVTTTTQAFQVFQQTTTVFKEDVESYPWTLILLPFIPLLLLPPVIYSTRKRVTITISMGDVEITEIGKPSDILAGYFRPSVARMQRGGRVTFHNKVAHELEIYNPSRPDLRLSRVNRVRK